MLEVSTSEDVDLFVEIDVTLVVVATKTANTGFR